MDDRGRKLTDAYGRPIRGEIKGKVKGCYKDIYDAEPTGKLYGDYEVDTPDKFATFPTRAKLENPEYKKHKEEDRDVLNYSKWCEKRQEETEYNRDILALAGIETVVTFEQDSARNQTSSLMKSKYNDFNFDLSGDLVLINKIPTKIQTGFLKDLYVGFTGIFGHSKAVKEICDVIKEAMSELFLLDYKGEDKDEQLLDKQK